MGEGVNCHVNGGKKLGSELEEHNIVSLATRSDRAFGEGSLDVTLFLEFPEVEAQTGRQWIERWRIISA